MAKNIAQKSNGISLAIVLLLFGGCALAFHARCLDTAIYQAQTFADKGYEVRIAYGSFYRNGEKRYYVQAQAKVDGKWESLESDTLILVGRRHNFIVKEYLMLEETKNRWKR